MFETTADMTDCFSVSLIFRVKEEVFWKNYFYRVSLIKQSAQLTALAAQQAAERRDREKTGTSPEGVHQKGTTTIPVFLLYCYCQWENKEFKSISIITKNFCFNVIHRSIHK